MIGVKFSKSLMVAASLVLALIAVALIFASEEWTSIFGVEPTLALTSTLQVLGAFMAAFAFMNWMSKGMTLGGIYGRPIVIGNMVQFAMNAILFVKLSLKISEPLLWVASVISIVLMLGFARLAFGKGID